MEQKIDLAEFIAGSLHHGANIFILGHVERHEKLGVFLRIGQLGHAAAIPLPLVVGPVGQVRESALGPLGHHLLSNGPSDRMIVRHAED